MTPPIGYDICLTETVEPTKSYLCHCEPVGVAISWYCVRIRTMYQEIATGRCPSR